MNSQDNSVLNNFIRQSEGNGIWATECKYFLGMKFYRGNEVSQDYKEALKWFQLAAEQGHEASKLMLGHMYFDGTGVRQDYDKALHYFFTWKNPRSDKWWGYVDKHTEFKLGLMYFYGLRVDQNYEEAVMHFEKSAKAGGVEAMIELSKLYYNGEGVQQDFEQSYFWVDLASIDGWEGYGDNEKNIASAGKEQVAKKLTPEQLFKVHERVGEQLTKYLDDCNRRSNR